MFGKLINNKIMYMTPITNHLTGGSWKKGWSGTVSIGGEIIYYDVINLNEDLKQDKYYKFELIDGKAKIMNHL